MYSIKEIYYTLQGEGAHSGRPAVFCRFSGCNLWSGRESDRVKAICKFCDTDFWGTDGERGGKYTAEQLSDLVNELFPSDKNKMVVCTGGEPLLQLDETLIQCFHDRDIEVAIETNGTLEVPPKVDWICMSPKAGTEIVLDKGDELKIVFPQTGIVPSEFLSYDFQHFYLQPMDSPQLEENIQYCLEYCLKHPRWKLSLQTHKLIGIK